MNPYAIIGAIVIVLSLMLGAERYGHSVGVNEQKSADQAQFDKLNSDLDKQKQDAATLWRNEAAKVIIAQADAAKFKHELEKAHVSNQIATDALRYELSSRGLRFASGESAGCRGGNQSAGGTEGNAASTSEAAIIQLPEALTRNLRQFAFDADKLADDYRLCYGYNNH